MQKIFQHIRRQPKAVRDGYALGLASTFTVLVLMIWIVSKPTGGNFLGIATEATSTSPFATLIKESKEKFAEAKDSVLKTAQSEKDKSNAAVISASSSLSEIILSEEDILIAVQKSSSATSSSLEPKSPKAAYTEVQIGTTSASIKVDGEGLNTTSTSGTNR